MFLSKLNQDEKKAFLELAYYTSYCDGEFIDFQKNLINGYLSEMDIENIDFDIDNFDLHKNLKIFSSKKSQRIVLIELMGLIYADNILHQKEKELLDHISKEFNISDNIIDIYANWTKAIFALYAQSNSLLDL